jgi:hypothetical protein
MEASIEDTIGEAGAFTSVAAAVVKNDEALYGLGPDIKKQSVRSNNDNKFVVMSSVGEPTDNNFQTKNGWVVRMSLVGTEAALTGKSN